MDIDLKSDANCAIRQKKLYNIIMIVISQSKYI